MYVLAIQQILDANQLIMRWMSGSFKNDVTQASDKGECNFVTKRQKAQGGKGVQGSYNPNLCNTVGVSWAIGLFLLAYHQE